MIDWHFPSPVSETAVQGWNIPRRCHVCAMMKRWRKDTRFMWTQCGVALCIHPCFTEYHTRRLLTYLLFELQTSMLCIFFYYAPWLYYASVSLKCLSLLILFPFTNDWWYPITIYLRCIFCVTVCIYKFISNVRVCSYDVLPACID